MSLTGWWLGHPSEKYESVNWDDDIPNIWENKTWQPNHQPVMNGDDRNLTGSKSATPWLKMSKNLLNLACKRKDKTNKTGAVAGKLCSKDVLRYCVFSTVA